MPRRIGKIVLALIVGALLLVVVCQMVVSYTPKGRTWLGETVARALAEQLHTEVRVGSVTLRSLTYVGVDDLCLLDQQGDTLCAASHVGLTARLLPLLKGRIVIDEVDLFGFDIRLHDDNYRFVVEALREATDDNARRTAELHIRDIELRHGRVQWDSTQVEDVALRARLDEFTQDSLALAVTLMQGAVAGYPTLNEGRLSMTGNPTLGRYEVQEAEVQLGASNVRARGTILAPNPSEPSEPSEPSPSLSIVLPELRAEVVPAEWKMVVPELGALEGTMEVEASVAYADSILSVEGLALRGEGLKLNAEGSVDLASGDFDVRIHEGEFEGSRGNGWDGMAEVLALLSHVDHISIEETALCKMGGAWLLDNLAMTTSLGDVHAEGTLDATGDYDVALRLTDFDLAALLDSVADIPVTHLTTSVTVHGNTDAQTLAGDVVAQDFWVEDELIDRMEGQFSLSPHHIDTQCRLSDREYRVVLGTALTSERAISWDREGLLNLEGRLWVDSLNMQTPTRLYTLQDLDAHLEIDEVGHHLDIFSDAMDLHAAGHPLEGFDFDIHLRQADAIKHLTDDKVHLYDNASIEGYIHVGDSSLRLSADIPDIDIMGNRLRDIHLNARSIDDSADILLRLQRQHEDHMADISLSAQGSPRLLDAVVAWDSHTKATNRGELAMTVEAGSNIHIHPTTVCIADTLWNVHEGDIRLGEALSMDGVGISQGERHLTIGGNPITPGVLDVSLKHIDLAYIFDLIGFDGVLLGGIASGTATVKGLRSTADGQGQSAGLPQVALQMDVEGFTLNKGPMGNMSLDLTCSDDTERGMGLDFTARIREPLEGKLSTVGGLINFPHETLDLNIQADNLDLRFLNHWTKNFFTDMEARGTGHTRVYGTFKDIDLEGDMQLDTFAVNIDASGTRYHSMPGDSIIMRSGILYIRHVNLHDRLHGTDRRVRSGVINGEVYHTKLRRFGYDLNIDIEDFLAFERSTSQEFGASVTAGGNIHVYGKPGTLTVDIEATPTEGTVLDYNLSTPDRVTEGEFITYKKGSRSSKGSKGSRSSKGSSFDRLSFDKLRIRNRSSRVTLSDIDDREDERVNINMHLNPAARLRLALGTGGSDDITLHGDGNLRATYYNKGDFQLYGTYRVDHGSYLLTMADIINKDFQFEKGGTITFGGNPMKADLDLQAMHTVSGVSLNDLATTGFATSSVKVNCLMHLGGQAEAPRLTFDFDIPHVNDDEKRMVRSLISTDEERNMQVLYLLGLGRFYTYDATTNQTETAMNGLLSSTLSGQLNNILSSAIGNRNWNFGTSLSTGSLGWEDMDIEGMLSGRAFSGRLLLNGSFGYRSIPVTGTNFIGDFDVQWLLNPSGTLSIKAYSETNDRYFTKSALTTQGLGFRASKDFNTLRELFAPSIKKKTKDKK